MTWPGWILPTLAATGGVLLLVATPLMQARLDTLIEWVGSRGNLEQKQAAVLELVGGSDRKLPLVREVRDRALLGIHPAIPLPLGADPRLSVELPTYVPRDLDVQLRAALRRASVESGFVLIIGRAASGKTRLAFEAINAELGDWRLFMPSKADHLTAYLASGADLSHTVVWLNETQDFLGAGQLTIETVRRVLANPKRPAVIIGTIWPEHYSRLRGSVGGWEGRDPDRESVRILELARLFTLDEQFSSDERARAHDLAHTDPRIEEALRHEEGAHLAQVLASAPELILQWLQILDPLAAAVVDAGVLARRCGHHDPIPATLLETLASSCMEGAQRARIADADWFIEAVADASEPVRGSVAPLTPDASTIGHVDGYCVADVLVQYAQHTDPDYAHVSEDQWRLLIDHSAVDACVRIGQFANFLGRYSLAEHSWGRAATAGNSDGMLLLGMMTELRGDYEQTLIWYEQAAQAGQIGAMENLGVLLGGLGRTAEARTWLQRGADAGSANAMSNLGYLLKREGSVPDAEHWYRAAATLGHVGAMVNLAKTLHERGEVDAAVEWYRRGAEQTYATMVAKAAETGISWSCEGSDEGQSAALLEYAEILLESGSLDDAHEWFERGATQLGDPRAAAGLADLLEARGHSEQADAWIHRAAEMARSHLASYRYLLVNAYGEAGVLRHARIMHRLAIKSAGVGESADCEKWARLAAEYGDREAMRTLWELLDEQGRHIEAAEWRIRGGGEQ
ncbi:tetratricopeptide repeat protein [Streptomyces sp. NPDC001980]|uniref:tetratricopeptide repeat protein n=1 Tax=Streptomyces sp. NPDC001980 TaxID=3157126 RepID=UPI003333F320